MLIEQQKASSITRKNKLPMDAKLNLELQQWMQSVADDRCKKSYANLFKHFAVKVRHVAYKQLGQLQSDAIANEVTQEVMTQLWRKAHLYHPEKGAVSTWVFTICRNVCFDLLRKSQNKHEINIAEDIWPLYEKTVTEDEIFTDHLSDKRLLDAVDILPDKQKQVVQGVFFQELSQEQLARQLNIPLGTVKSRLRLAMNKLKLELGERHD
jgi:RNA polymerase sigma-70 factor (ECF subfamily)